MTDATNIDAALVRRMVERQFPQWASLPVTPVEDGGWDNRCFRLGERMVVRLPSAAEYAHQVPKEHQWLPHLAPALPLPVPKPLALGEPMPGYPWPWSIYEWLEGESASTGRIANMAEMAADLARFLVALRSIDATGAPQPGAHNFFRGGALQVYDSEVRRAVAILGSKIDAGRVIATWETALATSWSEPPVWVHGDVSPGNLLVRDGRLAAVIDFGSLAAGDPACDLSIAWTFFSGKARETFFETSRADEGLIARARGWTLWKGVVTAAGLSETNALEWQQPSKVLEDVLAGPRTC